MNCILYIYSTCTTFIITIHVYERAQLMSSNFSLTKGPTYYTFPILFACLNMIWAGTTYVFYQ